MYATAGSADSLHLPVGINSHPLLVESMGGGGYGLAFHPPFAPGSCRACRSHVTGDCYCKTVCGQQRDMQEGGRFDPLLQVTPPTATVAGPSISAAAPLQATPPAAPRQQATRHHLTTCCSSCVSQVAANCMGGRRHAEDWTGLAGSGLLTPAALRASAPAPASSQLLVW
jgi:hypothetical protein